MEGKAFLERLKGESGPWQSEREKKRGVFKCRNREALFREHHEEYSGSGESPLEDARDLETVEPARKARPPHPHAPLPAKDPRKSSLLSPVAPGRPGPARPGDRPLIGCTAGRK